MRSVPSRAENGRAVHILQPLALAASSLGRGVSERLDADLAAREIKMKLRPVQCYTGFLLRSWQRSGGYIQRMLTEYWTVRHDNAELIPSLKQLLSADKEFFKSLVHKETTLEQAWNPAQKDAIVDTLPLIQEQINQAPSKRNFTRDLAHRLCHTLASTVARNIA